MLTIDNTPDSKDITNQLQTTYPYGPNHTCPNCGYCDKCGRGGGGGYTWPKRPYYPYYPYNPYYPNTIIC